MSQKNQKTEHFCGQLKTQSHQKRPAPHTNNGEVTTDGGNDGFHPQLRASSSAGAGFSYAQLTWLFIVIILALLSRQASACP